MPFNKKYIRNFCVIAHIDHGKSTICDRILESTGAVEKRNLSSQMLDDMELEQPVRTRVWVTSSSRTTGR